ncbi:MAG: hypothetical protein WDN28_07985 [Chthoniobacter sp.]
MGGVVYVHKSLYPAGQSIMSQIFPVAFVFTRKRVVPQASRADYQFQPAGLQFFSREPGQLGGKYLVGDPAAPVTEFRLNQDGVEDGRELSITRQDLCGERGEADAGVRQCQLSAHR